MGEAQPLLRLCNTGYWTLFHPSPSRWSTALPQTGPQMEKSEGLVVLCWHECLARSCHFLAGQGPLLGALTAERPLGARPDPDLN